MSCAKRYYLLVQKHPLRYHYFWKWMSVFTQRIPHARRQPQMMKGTWWTIEQRERAKIIDDVFLIKIFIETYQLM